MVDMIEGAKAAIRAALAKGLMTTAASARRPAFRISATIAASSNAPAMKFPLDYERRVMVELRRIELLTSAVRLQRSPI